MTTSFTGSLALVLVGHMPYLRAAGRRPDGEDPLHEMIAFSIVPVMNVLHDLRESGMRPAVSLAYSPILLEQLADIVVQKHFVVWMERWLARCEAALRRWQRQRQGHHAYLARFYLDWGQGILRSFTERYGRNLVAALRELCADGTVEPLGGAATHAYLPLLATSGGGAGAAWRGHAHNHAIARSSSTRHLVAGMRVSSWTGTRAAFQWCALLYRRSGKHRIQAYLSRTCVPDGLLPAV
jgi:hypothetical protein